MNRWISLTCALIVLIGAAMCAFYMIPEPVADTSIPLHPRDTPLGRVDFGEDRFHNFGSQVLDSKGSHTWQFKNVGPGMLEVWLEDTTCSCTVASLKNEKGEKKKHIPIPPGDSVPIEVSWEAHRWGRFGQTATIGTTDPETPTVTLTIMGTIIAPVDVQPSETVGFPEMSNEEPHRMAVSLVSADRPELKITRIASTKPGLIVGEATPMPREELEKRKVKAGYTLAVEVKPGMPLGRFSEEMTVETDHPKRPSIKLRVTGIAIGPISVTPSRLLMASVPVAKGATKELALVVRQGRETRFDVASKPDKLEVTVVKDDKPGAAGHYKLIVKVPPGLPPGVIDAPIVIKTDHPKASELKIPVSIYVSSRAEG